MGSVTRKMPTQDHRFPVGTSVSLHRAASRDGQLVPSGAAVATATVAADGSITFTGVDDQLAGAHGYVMAGTVGGQTVVARTSAGGTSWASRH